MRLRRLASPAVTAAPVCAAGAGRSHRAGEDGAFRSEKGSAGKYRVGLPRARYGLGIQDVETTEGKGELEGLW
jgi:hypothetical protein